MAGRLTGTRWAALRNRLTPAALEAFFHRYGALVLMVVGVLYYAQYYRSGLNLGGEGGTVAIVAMRLMEGQRPIVDTFLGYNVLWFYPVAWLFSVTGPNYIALRLYFFALCLAGGLLAYWVVRRVTGLGWYATLVAIGPIAIPGMLFRNYLGFLAMLNMLVLLHAYVFAHATVVRRWGWITAAGFVLGVTYLVRIDLGAFFTLLTAGLLVLYPWGFPGQFLPRARTALAAAALTVVMFGITHAPFYLDAHRRDYADAFTEQYLGWINLVVYLARQQVDQAVAPPPTPPEAPATESTAAPPPTDSSGDIGSQEYLQKRAVTEIFGEESLNDRIFILATYLPIPVAVLIVFFGLVALGRGLLRSDSESRTAGLALLVTTGSALTLFAQYFFFRPDTPHLSEFMVPFQVAVACAVALAVRWAFVSRLAAAVGVGLILLAVLDLGLYYCHAFPKESAGTIAARRKRTYELQAENGVHVRLKRREYEELQQLCDLIKAKTRPGDYLVTYPYSPTVNFMTDRPSFEHNLYVDNAHNVSTFHEDSLREFAQFRPAAIVIDNRAINRTEASRFANWAAPTYQWVKENYRYAGTFRRQEVYLRPDRADRASSPTDTEPSANDR